MKTFIKYAVFVFFLFMIPFKSSSQEYAIGADLSFLKSAEDRGYEFKENNEVKPGLKIFTDHGYNWIRLRLFHTPTELPNSLDYTICPCQKRKECRNEVSSRLSLFRYLG